MKIVSTAFNPAFIGWCLPEWSVSRMRLAFPDIDFARLTSPERILDEVRDADVLFAVRMTDRMFEAAEKLKWIHTPMAGVNSILIPAVVSSRIRVSNSRGVHGPSMSEHAMALILAFSRRLHDFMDFQRKGRWEPHQPYVQTPSLDELEGKTIGILGFGSIGSAVARHARAFGMRVVGIRRESSRPGESADAIYPPERLDEILPQLDYLVITIPLTPETENMIDRDRLARLKPTAFLINLARGEIVDQDALIEALEAGRLAGAGLDVTVPEPLPPGHRLFSTRNVIITPHISQTSPRLWHRIMDLFIENVRRFLDGRELINEVDKGKGY